MKIRLKEPKFGQYITVDDVHIELNSVEVDEYDNVYGEIEFVNNSDNSNYNDMLDELNFKINMDYRYNPENPDIIDVYIGGFDCYIDKSADFSLLKRIMKLQKN